MFYERLKPSGVLERAEARRGEFRGLLFAVVQNVARRFEERALADGLAGRRRLELLDRRFGGNEAIQEIADTWGVPAQDVHNAYRKARHEFCACLREVVAAHLPEGMDPSAECRRLLGLLA